MINPIQYLKESKGELQKVSWPSRQTTLQYTGVVVGISVIATLILGGLDVFFNYILTTFIL